MLTSNELASMRDAINQLLPDTCGIISYAYASDGAGGQVETASGTATANCRLDKKQANKQLAAGEVIPFSGFMLSLPYNTTITELNRVTHGGYTYNVISVNNDISWVAVKRVMLERVP